MHTKQIIKPKIISIFQFFSKYYNTHTQNTFEGKNALLKLYLLMEVITLQANKNPHSLDFWSEIFLTIGKVKRAIKIKGILKISLQQFQETIKFYLANYILK